MKKLTFISFAFMVVTCLSLFSCGDDEEDDSKGAEGSTIEHYSFTVNGMNYYYGLTFDQPASGIYKTYISSQYSLGEYKRRSTCNLLLNAKDTKYQVFDEKGNFVIYQDYNRSVECFFTLIDFIPASDKKGNVIAFLNDGDNHEIYNKIKYSEKSPEGILSTFSWKGNVKGQIKFVSYRKTSNGFYVLTMEFDNVTMYDNANGNPTYSSRSNQLVLNGQVMFTDNPAGEIGGYTYPNRSNKNSPFL